MAEKAKWDSDLADAKAKEFGNELAKLDGEAIAKLRELWKQSYMIAGHKRLARVLLSGK